MAEAAGNDTVNISVNGIDIAVPKGELIVESVKRLGLEIPIFCYHPRMKPVGMCRMCLVEVGFKQQDGSIRKMPKPQAACSLPASEGMAIFTDTEQVHKDRRGVLEFLLINHPLDCPICDRGGECPLQQNTLFYGPSTSRFIEMKRHAPKAYPLSQHVTLDLERCIQCGRCVRFTEEISGDAQLAFRFRGSGMQPSTFRLGDFTSKFSGNTIEICPVGALTSTKYRFRARPWDLESKPGICTLCSNGCAVWLDARKGKVIRVNGRTNEAVNEEWTCDKGKFGHDYTNSVRRLTKPMIREGDRLVESDWPSAYEQVAKAFAIGGNEVGAIVGGMSSNEDLYLLQKLFRTHFRSNNLDHRFTRNLQKAEDRLETKLGLAQIQSTISSYEQAKGILVFGASLADEEPILYLRIRKAAVNHGAKIVAAFHEPTEIDFFADVVLRYRPGTAHILAAGLLALLAEGKDAALAAASARFTPEAVEKATGVPAAGLRRAAQVLSADAVVATTRRLLNLDHGQAIAECLAAAMYLSGGAFNLYSLTANGQGAEDLGILPDLLPGRLPIPADAQGLGTHETLRGCADGRIKALWLVNVDPFAVLADRDLLVRALETVPFLVVQGPLETDSAHYASVVLPACAPGEEDGSYTNIERRVQHMGRSLTAPGNAKPGWRIFSEMALRLEPGTPHFNAGEVREELATVSPLFSPIVGNLPGPVNEEGVVLTLPDLRTVDLIPVAKTVADLKNAVD